MSHRTAAPSIVVLPHEIVRQGEYRSLVAQVEARTGQRVTTYCPGRDCHVARLDNVDQKGVYHSAWDAVEALLG